MTTSRVEIGSKFEDERGVIQNILTAPINHVALIESKKGTTRSNHYHKEGGHHLYVMSGRVCYCERNLDGSDVLVQEFGPGEMFFSGPMKVHQVQFMEDSVLLSLNLHPRGPQFDKGDTITEKF